MGTLLGQDFDGPQWMWAPLKPEAELWTGRLWWVSDHIYPGPVLHFWMAPSVGLFIHQNLTTKIPILWLIQCTAPSDLQLLITVTTNTPKPIRKLWKFIKRHYGCMNALPTQCYLNWPKECKKPAKYFLQTTKCHVWFRGLWYHESWRSLSREILMTKHFVALRKPDMMALWGCLYYWSREIQLKISRSIFMQTTVSRLQLLTTNYLHVVWLDRLFFQKSSKCRIRQWLKGTVN